MIFKEMSLPEDLFLQKILPHMKKEQFLVVGGLAIRYHLNQHGVTYPLREFNDLDLKAFSIDVIKPSVQKDFLIYHYHPLKNGSFFVALVDPGTKIKVDIFDTTIKHEEYTVLPFHEWKLKIVAIEDQLVKTVYDIGRISEESKVDPKQFSDTDLLLKIANIEKAQKIWGERNYKNYPSSINEAIERAKQIAKEHPEWLKEKPFRRPEPYVCPSCENTSDFKVTPMEEVYKVLGGYVE